MKKYLPYYIIKHINKFYRLQSLLDEPNPNSPANNCAAILYTDNRREYNKKIMQIVEQSWEQQDEDEEEKQDQQQTEEEEAQETQQDES